MINSKRGLLNLFSSSVRLGLYLFLVMIVDHTYYLRRATSSCCSRRCTLSKGLLLIRRQTAYNSHGIIRNHMDNSHGTENYFTWNNNCSRCGITLESIEHAPRFYISHQTPLDGTEPTTANNRGSQLGPIKVPPTGSRTNPLLIHTQDLHNVWIRDPYMTLP